MKEIVRGILALTTIAAIIVIGYFILLYPKHDYNLENVDKGGVSVSSILLKAMPKEFLEKNKKVKVEIDITREELAQMIYTSIDKKQNIENINVEIKDNKITVYILKKYFDVVPVEVSFNVDIKSENDRLILTLNEANLGKLDLGISKTLKKIKDKKIPFIEVRTVSKEIILSDEDLNNVLDVTKVNTSDESVKIDADIKFSSVIDFINIIEKLTKG